MTSEQGILQRINSSCRRTSKIIPSNQTDLTSAQSQTSPSQPKHAGAFFRSFINVISLHALLQTCKWLKTPSVLLRSSSTLGRTVTGTLFGNRKGHVSFAVQEDPRSDPVFLIELASSTSNLIKEMSSGLVRIALERKLGSSTGTRSVRLFEEPMWTMYCNGKKCGYAIPRTCAEQDWHVLSTIQTVSIGAGVIPVDKRNNLRSEGGEVMYMRGRFERVVGNRDSEAFYMLNPDGMGGPELSIFLLRI